MNNIRCSKTCQGEKMKDYLNYLPMLLVFALILILGKCADDARAIDYLFEMPFEQKIMIEQSKPRATGNLVIPTEERKQKMINLIKSIAKEDVDVLIALARSESAFDSFAVGPHNELGLFQLKPSTARIICGIKRKVELYDAEINTQCAVKYWAQLKSEFITVEKTYYSWNLGPEKTRHTNIKKLSCRKDEYEKLAKCHYKTLEKFIKEKKQ
jgi:soluble lytic murein transglycosylase-like protein